MTPEEIQAAYEKSEKEKAEYLQQIENMTEDTPYLYINSNNLNIVQQMNQRNNDIRLQAMNRPKLELKASDVEMSIKEMKAKANTISET